MLSPAASLVPTETSLCRNKVTLLPVMLRSKDFNARIFTVPPPLPRHAGLYRRGNILGDIKDITVIDARGTHGQQAN